MKWYTTMGLCALLTTGCAATDSSRPVAQAELLDGTPFGVSAQDGPPPTQVLGVSPEMRAFLDERLPEDAGEYVAVRTILSSILEGGLNLQYDNFYTATAAEAFARRQGNCLSFTNLFVALAREAGVAAEFQEVEVPPTWAFADDVYLYNLHINARVQLPTGVQVVDFNIEEYDPKYRTRRISDTEAIARYYNNMGVHYLQNLDYAQSFLYLRKAIQLRDHTAHFWTNLGTLYRRYGEFDLAEGAFLTAIDVGNEPTAMSNLARQYRQLGKTQLAEHYEAKVELFRQQNPYYLFHLAEEAYARGDYDEAVKLARSAIRKDDSEHNFYRLLGLAYMQAGEPALAAENFRDAALRVKSDEERAAYNRKLRSLAGG